MDFSNYLNQVLHKSFHTLIHIKCDFNSLDMDLTNEFVENCRKLGGNMSSSFFLVANLHQFATTSLRKIANLKIKLTYGVQQVLVILNNFDQNPRLIAH